MFFDYLRVFGCLCFATKLNNFDKFLEMADKFVLLGQSSDDKGYKLLSFDTNSIFISRDVKFTSLYFLLNLTLVDKSFNIFSLVDLFSYYELNNPEYINHTSNLDDLSVNLQMDGSSATERPTLSYD